MYNLQPMIFHVASHPNHTWYTQCVTFGSFPNETAESAYLVFGMVMMYFMPLIVILVTYSIILFKINKKANGKALIDILFFCFDASHAFQYYSNYKAIYLRLCLLLNNALSFPNNWFDSSGCYSRWQWILGRHPTLFQVGPLNWNLCEQWTWNIIGRPWPLINHRFWNSEPVRSDITENELQLLST